jgi:hypothetical protein
MIGLGLWLSCVGDKAVKAQRMGIRGDVVGVSVFAGILAGPCDSLAVSRRLSQSLASPS